MVRIFVYTLCFLLTTIVFSQNSKIDSLKNQLVKITDLKEKSETYIKIARIYGRTGEYENFKRYSDSTLFLAKKNGFKKLEAQALIYLGICYNKTGEYKKALLLYAEALDIVENFPKEKELKISILLNAGNTHNMVGMYIDARKEFSRILTLVKDHKADKDIEIAALIGIGMSYTMEEKWEESLTYFHNSAAKCKAIDRTRSLALSYNNIGFAYSNLKEYQKAIEYLEKSLALYKPLGNEVDIMKPFYNMGVCYLNIGDIDKSITYLTKANNIAEKNELTETLMDCHLELSKAYAAQKNYKKSYKMQEKYDSLKNVELTKRNTASHEGLKQKFDKKIEHQKEQIQSLNTLKNNLFLIGCIVILVLGSLLWMYILKKKSLLLQKNTLAVEYKILNEENTTLKTKLQTLAQAKKSTSTQPKKSWSSLKYNRSSLTKKQHKLYMDAILEYMENEKPYLDVELSQSSLANRLSITPHHLSEVLSLSFEKNFYDFINIYRVNEAKTIMANPKNGNLKITSIAYDSGFKSKSSFNRIFKKHTRLTPSEYREKYKKEVLLQQNV